MQSILDETEPDNINLEFLNIRILGDPDTRIEQVNDLLEFKN
jgi:hypothetical protein